MALYHEEKLAVANHANLRTLRRTLHFRATYSFALLSPLQRKKLPPSPFAGRGNHGSERLTLYGEVKLVISGHANVGVSDTGSFTSPFSGTSSVALLLPLKRNNPSTFPFRWRWATTVTKKVKLYGEAKLIISEHANLRPLRRGAYLAFQRHIALLPPLR